jgi:hypothetical protein
MNAKSNNLRPKALFSKTPVKNHKKSPFPLKTLFFAKFFAFSCSSLSFSIFLREGSDLFYIDICDAKAGVCIHFHH